MTTPGTPASLRRAIGGSGFFTLAFGAMVGSGWVVVLGGWLAQAGPGGSALAFLLGGAVMIIVALCYGELAARFPMAGGEFLYTLQTFGPFPGFLVGWFLTLAQISVCTFEGIALAWFVRILAPGVAMGTAYTVAGSAVTWDALVIGLSSAMVIAFLHLRGARSAIRFQNIVTFGFIAVSILLIACGFSLGSLKNLLPLIGAMGGRSPLLGMLWVFAVSAYFLNGWQASIHAIEERRAEITIRTAVVSMILGIAAAAIFYACIVLSASMALPWRSLLSLELPAAAAFRSLGGGILGGVVLAAAIVSLIKTWSACAWVATRLLLAQSRYGLLPRALSELDAAHGVPRKAILLVTALAMIGIALGRGAILPIVDTLAICYALSIILCLAVLIHRRKVDSERPAFTVPGGMVTIVVAMVGASTMVGVGLVQPFLERGGVPVEWVLLVSWAFVGSVVWHLTRSRRGRANDLTDIASSNPILDASDSAR